MAIMGGYRDMVDNVPVLAHPEGVLVRVWAVPRAAKTEISGWHNGRVKVRVMAPPEAGQANQQVSRLLADRLGVPVELLRGVTGREKVFLARRIEIEDALAKLYQ